MSPLTKKALKDITNRKLRAFLTILGIGVGVMGLSAVNVASDQLKSSFNYTLDVSASPDIQFYTSPTTTAIVPALERVPNVKIVQAEDFATTTWKIPTGHKPLTIFGISDFSNVRLSKFELVQGRLPGKNQILMESSNRSLGPVEVGKHVRVVVGNTTRLLTVSGLVRTRGYAAAFSSSGQAYMRQADVSSIFRTPGVNLLLFAIHHKGQDKATAQAIGKVLTAHNVLTLGTQLGHGKGDSLITNGLFGVMRVLAIVALLLSIFLLISTITTLVTEQVPVIGTMKALGATRGVVMRNYLTSVALYGVAGTAAGLVLGALVGYLLVSYVSGSFGLDIGPLVISPWLILLSIVIGIGVPMLAAVLPIYFGTRITVRQALGGYGLDQGVSRPGSGLTAAVERRVRFIPQTVQLGVRSMFRKRTRAFLTLLALAASGAAFLSVQTTAYSFGRVLNTVFDTYNADIFAFLPRPEPYDKMRSTIATVPGVGRTEPYIQTAVTTPWGDAILTGVLPQTHLYKKRIDAGRWLTPGERNAVVISKDGADRSHLKVGDWITFHDSLHRARWRVVGIVTDYSGVGLGAGSFGTLLAGLAPVNRFEHLPASYAQGLLIQSKDRSPTAVDRLSSRIDTRFSAAGSQAQVTTVQQQIDRNNSALSILYVLLYAVAIIVALVGAIGLFNSLAMSVLERRREIGILRSMGATGGKVAQVFWTEGISLGVIAWIIGTIVGIPAAYGFVALLGSLLFNVPFAFSVSGLVLMLLFILVVATLASLGPVWGAARIRIAQTLRYE